MYKQSENYKGPGGFGYTSACHSCSIFLLHGISFSECNIPLCSILDQEAILPVILAARTMEGKLLTAIAILRTKAANLYITSDAKGSLHYTDSQ